MKTLFIYTAFFFVLPAFADTPFLIDGRTGKYLGNLSTNKYDPNSVSNPYGRYGSEYSPDSINNPYGRYGSQYSNDSVNNPYATNPPRIIQDESRSIDGGGYYDYSPRY